MKEVVQEFVLQQLNITDTLIKHTQWRLPVLETELDTTSMAPNVSQPNHIARFVTTMTLLNGCGKPTHCTANVAVHCNPNSLQPASTNQHPDRPLAGKEGNQRATASSGKWTLFIGVALGTGFLLCAVGFVLGALVWKRQQRREQNDLPRVTVGDMIVQPSTELLGQGGQAAVFKAIDIVSGQIVAVKRYITGENGTIPEQCQREFDFLSQISHPNVVKVFGMLAEGVDTEPEKQHPYQTKNSTSCTTNKLKDEDVQIHEEGKSRSLMIVMECLGSSLSTLLAAAVDQDGVSKGLPRVAVSQYACDILSGIHCLHQHGLVHRDIKPSNILMDEVGNCKVSDLGLARSTESLVLTRSTTRGSCGLVGTIAYTPPEALTTADPSTAGDIWMAGLVVLQMYTGNPPWGGLLPQQILYQLGTFPCQQHKQLATNNTLPPTKHSESLMPPSIPHSSTNSSIGSVLQVFYPGVNNVHDGELRDFLEKCLNFEPEFRWSAKQLLKHPFIVNRFEHEVQPLRSPGGRPEPCATLQIPEFFDAEWDSSNEHSSDVPPLEFN
eukprot:TRINITY_DN66382_c3_g1_i2.p1 TRINITY_DN66382_c3_g1~~TRINITY_DN66382_c3_g1_i2.p1  ORF type:complete len:622 (+),score=66.38 TRINITY_DN66382_c3_g1_i2:213-1868(+)